eukprot:gnl/MRDRNA2_/MRDRNA2_195204_c0_seq1.p1 gnl/MRDRNA2_/MRDRNA2_195204_c0~~gnl/MRDRNA2_/MRDRNA2_195204_c0_seq1.p1  ORF type:complete len:217 (+),score=19.55 gnl/MRDRNA2_/MRDRNA2_195204_c0_seq1:170-820(+)
MAAAGANALSVNTLFNLLTEKEDESLNKFQYQRQILPKWHFRRGTYGGGASPLLYNPSPSTSIIASSLNVVMFLFCGLSIIAYLNQPYYCLEPFFQYVMLVAMESIFACFYYFIMSHAEMGSDAEWVTHVTTVVLISIFQFFTLAFGINMVLIPNPYARPPNVEVSVCYRDVRSFYTNTFFCTLWFMVVVCYTMYAVYFIFVPQVRAQLKALKDFR